MQTITNRQNKTAMSAKYAFKFDANKCVGCMACVVGCSIENDTLPQLNWRMVNNPNPLKHPDLPVFHFSLACNHCEQALCMQNCPALAYTRDKITGAIVHHAEACIGCKYCTWACPYDAPKFNPQTQIIEKCNFCTQRITDGLKPACVMGCPVGALEFENEYSVDYSRHITPGFVNAGIKPAIHLVALRKENTKPIIENIDAVEIPLEQLRQWTPQLPSKVLLHKEWTLVGFTIAVPVLVSWLASAVIAKKQVILHELFLAIAILSILLASFHIGKKTRLWRFVLNLKGSWLSREIFFYSLFLLFSAVYIASTSGVLIGTAENILGHAYRIGYLAIVCGTFAIISVDMVYKFFVRTDTLRLHSAMASITVALLLGWFGHHYFVLVAVALIKLVLYSLRKVELKKNKKDWLPTLSTIRIAALILPVAVIPMTTGIYLYFISIILFIGEIIDRCEFYNESEIQTPQRELTNITDSYHH